MRIIPLIIMLVFCMNGFYMSAQIVPASQLVDWTYAGHSEGIYEPDTMVNVMDFGAVADGVTNDQPAITAAIAALSGKYGVVYLPPGDYNLQSTITLPDSVILRGAGEADTKLLFDFASSGTHGIYINGSQPYPYVDVSSGYTFNSNTITVADASNFSIGGYAEILQDNDTAWDTNPISWADESLGQIIHITAINGNELQFDAPLRIDYSASLSPRIRPIEPAKQVGIECLYMERLADATTGAGYNVWFRYAVNSWLKGVHSNKSVAAHCMITASSNIEVTGSYFHHAFTYDGSGTRGYGVCINHHAGEALITNNQFEHLRHAMMVKQGANGNVFSFNYSFDPHRDEFPSNAGGDISLHGHYPFANLFEHNIVQNIYTDDYWGPSGPRNTFLRNRAELYGLLNTSSGTVDQNYVGSEVTNTGIILGQYWIEEADNFCYNNNIKGSITPAGTTSLSDDSYYLSSAPDFWDISDAWPSIGGDNAFNTGNIPAKANYDAGIHTTCPTHPDPNAPVYSTLKVKAKAFLQGTYDASISTMSTHLVEEQLLPKNQPFNTLPWLYEGEDSISAAMPTDIVDWVLVEVRDAANNDSILQQKAGLLRNDGQILDPTSLTEGLAIDSLEANEFYFLSIKTRNHLAVLSNESIQLPNTDAFDFTDHTQVLDGLNQLTEVGTPGSGSYALRAGDINADGIITVADLNIYLSEASLINQYLSSDVNLDRVVTVADFNLYRLNISILGVEQIRY